MVKTTRNNQKYFYAFPISPILMCWMPCTNLEVQFVTKSENEVGIIWPPVL